MLQKTMYPAINNSPQTSISAAIAANAVSIALIDGAALPEAPNICTIGVDEDAELILYTSKNGNTISGCTRGFNGTVAKAWPAMTAVYRGFSAYDHDSFIANIEKIEEAVGGKYGKDELDSVFGALLNEQNYYDVMRAWFEANGSAVVGDLADLCERWYTLSRKGWEGGTRFWNTDKSQVSTGEKVGDNAGLVCEPSTNTTAATDDYARIPLFAPIDCNWYLDNAGKRHIRAIKGIKSLYAFVKTEAQHPVGVIQMAPWTKMTQEADTYTHWMTDKAGMEGYAPVAEAVDLDGTVHSWVVHAKYGLGDEWSSISGAKMLVWSVSHNTCRTNIPAAFGGNSRYCGKSCADDAWMKLHVYIKYASLTLDNIMNGCCSYYNNTVHPAAGETGVKRVLLTSTDAAKFLVGSSICLGTTAYDNSTTDRSVVNRAKLLSITTVDVSGTSYSAINLDVDAPFDVTTDLFVQSYPWHTGATDDVLGNDGSPYSNTSSKEPYKLQGIETSYGCYEVIGDSILRYKNTADGCVLAACVCRDATKIATSVTADYRETSYNVGCPAADGWNYIKRLGRDDSLPECMFPSEIGGSSSTFTRDAMYILANSTSSYEWLGLGYLRTGLAHAGLSYVDASFGLGFSWWYFGGRLSANGSRGEYAA